MNNRLPVHRASGSGGGGRAHVGYASGISGMRIRLHNQNGGASGAENAMGQLDYLTLTSVSQDIVNVVSVGGKLYSEYAFFCSIPDNDSILTSTGTIDYYAGTGVGHFPFGK